MVVVDHQGDLRILADVAQTLESARRGALRFLIDGRVEIFAVENKADRNDVGLAGFVGCRQVGNASGEEQAPGASR